jgi:hypothetical protein
MKVFLFEFVVFHVVFVMLFCVWHVFYLGFQLCIYSVWHCILGLEMHSSWDEVIFAM